MKQQQQQQQQQQQMSWFVSTILLMMIIQVSAFSTPQTFSSSSSITRRRNLINTFTKIPTLNPNSSPSTITTSTSLSATTTTTNQKTTTKIRPGIGIEGCKQPSLSKINTLPTPIQSIIVISLLSLLLSGTSVFVSTLDDLLLSYSWFETWSLTWPLLGIIYAIIGITHFTMEESYSNFVPPNGTWGIWYIPGPTKFHVWWTGLAEFILGLGLFLDGILRPLLSLSYSYTGIGSLASDCAAALFMLTLVVTPANIYVLTHGARFPLDAEEEVPVVVNLVRGLFQVVLLGLFYEMGRDTFDAVLGML